MGSSGREMLHFEVVEMVVESVSPGALAEAVGGRIRESFDSFGSGILEGRVRDRVIDLLSP